MHKVCKIRFYPNNTQLEVIHNNFDGCRWVKNLYKEFNMKEYADNKRFITGYDFSKIINNLKKNNPEYSFIDNCSSKAIGEAIQVEEKTFKRFFKYKHGFPKWHSKKKSRKESFFFIKDSIHYTNNPNIISIPVLGKVRISEHSYLPKIKSITSGRVIREYDKYYLAFTYKTNRKITITHNNGIGIDLGIKQYAYISDSNSNSYYVNHFRNNPKYQEYYRKIQRLQMIISDKVEINYGKLLNTYLDKNEGNEPSNAIKTKLKGESYSTSRIKYLRKKIRKLYSKMNNIRRDFILKLVSSLVVRTKPHYITIENLSIKEMLKKANHNLARYIQESGWYLFRTHLSNKCHEYGIELRIADKYFASSKKCSECGYKRDDLKLSDRVFICPKCGLKLDRDQNASINLAKLKKYSVDLRIT
jgi:putative transposase